MASAMNVFSVLYGVPVWGFALLWIALAASLTLRTIRSGLPFGLTWWSFTFPVGTFVTGTTQLALHTSLPAFRWAAVTAFDGLLGAWLVVGIRTALASLRGDPAPAASRLRAGERRQGMSALCAGDTYFFCSERCKASFERATPGSTQAQASLQAKPGSRTTPTDPAPAQLVFSMRLASLRSQQGDM